MSGEEVAAQLSSVLYGDLCCVYGMGVARPTNWLASAKRVSPDTMRRRLKQLHALGLVQSVPVWSERRAATHWTVTELGRQVVVAKAARRSRSALRRKP